MNLSVIKPFVLSSFKKVKRILKDTLKLPYAKTYIFLSFLLTLIFMVGTFPYEVIIRNQLQNIKSGSFKNILVGDIDVSFFGLSTINNMHLTMKDGGEMNLKNISINANLNPYSLFISNIYKADIQIKEMQYSSSKVNLNSHINSNISIEYDKKTKTTNNGIIKLIAQNTNLKISEFTLPPTLGSMPIELPQIKISSLNFDSNINKNVLIINNCKISGQHLRGSIKGNINLTASSFNNSRLNLSIKIDANSRVISKYREFIDDYVGRDGYINFKLKGTISRPKPEFAKKPVKNQSRNIYKQIPGQADNVNRQIPIQRKNFNSQIPTQTKNLDRKKPK